MIENQPLVKQASEWSKADRLQLISIQRLVSCLGFFLAIVECTNLVITNNYLSNKIVLTFALVSALLCIFFLASLIWSINQYRALNNATEEDSDVTDNQNTRMILFFGILLTIIFIAMYIIYTHGEQQLLNNYMAEFTDKKLVHAYEDHIKAQRFWVDSLSIIIFILGSFTIYTSFACSASMITWRLMIYLLGIMTVFSCFIMIDSHNNLKAITGNDKFFGGKDKLLEGNGSDQEIVWWAYTISMIVALATTFFLALIFLANARRLKIGYLILGTFFLICVMIQVPATGAIFRNYTDIDKEIGITKCHNFMGDIHADQLEKLGCPNKYLYENDDRSKCPVEEGNGEGGPGDCFKNPADKCKYPDDIYKTRVWEDSLVTEPNDYSVEACLNKNCCGVVANLYTETILTACFGGVTYILFSFSLAAFSFHLSTKEKGEKLLNKNLQGILLVVFSFVLVVGLFYVLLTGHATYNQQSLQQEFQRVEVEPIVDLQHYVNTKVCHTFSSRIEKSVFIREEDEKSADKSKKRHLLCDITEGNDWWQDESECNGKDDCNFQCDKSDACGFKKKLGGETQNYPIQKSFRSFDALVNGNKHLDDDQDLNGYIVTISTPAGCTEKKAGVNLGVWEYECKNGNKESEMYFYFDDDFEKDNYYEIINYRDAIEIQKQYMPKKKYETLKLRKGFAVMGEKSYVLSLLSEKLKVCGYEDASLNWEDSSNKGNNEFLSRFYLATIQSVNLDDMIEYEKVNPDRVNPGQNVAQVQKSLKHKQAADPYQDDHLPVTLTDEAFSTDENSKLDKELFAQLAYRYKNYEVEIFDVTTDKPIKGANVTLFYYDQKALKKEFWDSDDKEVPLNLKKDNIEDYKKKFEQIYSCQNTEPYVQIGKGRHKTDFEGETGEDGKVAFGYVLLIRKDTNQFAIKYEAQRDLNRRTWMAYVTAPGYQDNCRIIELYADRTDGDYSYKDRYYDKYYADIKPAQDIGLSPILGKDQSRVVLEFRKTVYAGNIDLFGTFTNVDETKREMCVAGPTEPECGGMVYHGDSTLHHIGRTTEAITLKEIGQVDYLFFLNREISSSVDMENVDNESIYLNEIGMSPVVKYYVEQSNTPKYVRFWVQSDYPKGIPKFNTDKDVSFLQFCVKGSLNTNIVYEFVPQEYEVYNVENSKFDKVKMYFNVWGYEGDFWNAQIGNNILPDNSYMRDGVHKYICGDFGVPANKLDWLVDTNRCPFDTSNPDCK